MLGPMVRHVRGGRRTGGPALLAVAGQPGEAAAALDAGADLIDPGDLVRDQCTALTTGALLLCQDAAAAGACGLPPGRLVVEVLPGAVAATSAAGWATLVDADRAAWLAAAQAGPGLAERDLIAGAVAIAALSCWLGAAIVRTRYVSPVRRALDMTASIAGSRPPARAVRGLA
jgi:hypothetical protein